MSEFREAARLTRCPGGGPYGQRPGSPVTNRLRCISSVVYSEAAFASDLFTKMLGFILVLRHYDKAKILI